MNDSPPPDVPAAQDGTTTTPPKRLFGRSAIIVDVVALLILEAFLLWRIFDVDLVFLDTTIAGGDTPAFIVPLEYLRDVLLPAGHPLGWDPSNFAGYAPFQYYNLAPFLLITAMSWVMPLTIAFKIVTLIGPLTLPLAAYFMLVLMRCRRPAPMFAACAAVLYLINEGNTMWGGNLLSLLAGEFCFSIGLSLSILFWGTIWRGVETKKFLVVNSLLLAVNGLCHPITFLYASFAGTFFLIQRRDVLANLWYLVRMYAGAACLMAVWLLPLLARLPYATKINWVWHDLKWIELVPHVFWPMAIPAAILLVLSCFWSKARTMPALFFPYMILLNVISFLNGTAVGLPEIRFIPAAQCALLLMGAYAAGLAFQKFKMRSLVGLIAVLGVLLWMDYQPPTGASWVDWNYSGLERKPDWETFKKLNEFIRGDVNDARVYYEHSTKHNVFGSIRCFETIPYFSGRSTLEGTLLQAAINAPFIYYIQAELSLEASHVIPGYSYSKFNVERGTKHLEMYNVSHMIAYTRKMKDALFKHKDWRWSYRSGQYEIFELITNNNEYVVVPPYRPLVFEDTEWRHDFHRWFEDIDVLDVPLVPASTLAPPDLDLFPPPINSVADIVKIDLDNGCNVETTVTADAIEFTTDCPGKPHLVRMSYFPNWQVEGADRIYLASPALMMVFPNSEKVRIYYGRTAADYGGMIIAMIAALMMLFRGFIHRRTAPLIERIQNSASNTLVRRGGRGLVGLCVLIIVGALVHGTFNYYDQGAPQRLHDEGWKRFHDDAKYPEARAIFEELTQRKGYSQLKVTAIFFVAQTYLREQNHAEAIKHFQQLVRDYPESHWIAESRYHVGLCHEELKEPEKAMAMYRAVINNDPSNVWAGHSKNRLDDLEKHP